MLLEPPRRTLQRAAIALLAFAVFSPALLGEFVSDDAELVRANSHGVIAALSQRFWHDTSSLDGLYGAAYRPISQLALALAVAGFGVNAAGLHLVNLLLHVAISLLAWRWLRSRLQWQVASQPTHELAWAALPGALLFAVHPVHAESVAWISGATDLWMTLGLLLGFECLEHTRGLARGAAACCFAAAALSKEPALLAPLLCGVDAWASGRKPREQRARTLWCSLGVCAALVVILVRNASRQPAAISFGRPQDMLAALGFYVRMAFEPTTLTFQAPPYRRAGDLLGLPSWSLIVGAMTCLLTGWLLWRSLRGATDSSRPRAALARHGFADLLWLLVLLTPVIVLQPEQLSDRFLYAPSLGVVALTARGLLAIWGSTRLRLQRWTALATCLALTACVVQSARAAGYFESEETLWSSQIAAFPDHLKAIDALAESRLARGQRHASRTLFERGLVRATQVHQRGWVLHYLGHLALFEASGVPPWDPGQHNGKVHCEELFASGRLAYSREPLRVATHVSRRELAAWLNADPSFVLLPCARILVAAQAPEHASVLARRALAVAPTDLGARELLAVALARAGRFDDALTALRAPELAGAHAALAPLAQRIEAAQQLLATDLSTDPSRSALMRARAALVLGDTTTARTALAPLLGPRGDHGHEAVHLVAQSYVNEGRFELAEQTLQAAARLAPADPYWAGALEGLAEARSADAEKRAH